LLASSSQLWSIEEVANQEVEVDALLRLPIAAALPQPQQCRPEWWRVPSWESVWDRGDVQVQFRSTGGLSEAQ
jgi:hypothetical protein